MAGIATASLAGLLARLPHPGVVAATVDGTPETASPGRALYQLASTIVSTLAETHYSHHIYINAGQGVYDTNCSGFVDYLLGQVAPAQYGLLPQVPATVRPRAFVYERFFSDLATGMPAPGWSSVPQLAGTQPGDMLAWDLRPINQHYDTGHVVIVAAPPSVIAAGTLSLPVIDASALRHYADSRPRGTDGVGTGNIHFQVDASGAPIAFQFDAGEAFHQSFISMGRLVGS